ncbi:hypothetical protein BU23DRAFT_96408 [Bimuria novae-zelandiae CBS 107.79]|uniref:BTB domain-containing protein n=1 Tax=Bimuria novae-zelandiae CBS 107.79 TaxID=1447943 RepID=A0A6A5VF85_9PLEO|nr:hypothetical protein BU23DRAFT_96408 [Bimuria novae-zelandiae CBS 107.79]
MATTKKSEPPSLSTLARGGNMITVDVGEEHVKYSVYAELISYYSNYFKATLHGPWKEAEDRVIELPDIEPRVFDIFIDWLYTQKLPKKTLGWILPPPEQDTDSTRQFQLAERQMIKAYVLADRFIVPQFRVAIFDYFANLCNRCGTPPYYDAIIYAFDNLPPTSAMLTLLVKLHCAYWDEKSDTMDDRELKLREELPQDFFLRGMFQFAKMKDKPKAKEIACCDCHKETAPKEREGCDTCMPLPEVKEETQAGGDTQADTTDAGGDDQAPQIPTAPTENNGPVNNDEADQVDPDSANNGTATDQSIGLANQGDQIYPTSQAGEQAAGPADQSDGQTTEGDQASQNIQHDGQVDPITESAAPSEGATEPTEVVAESVETSVSEAETTSTSESNGVAIPTSEAHVSVDDRVMDA